MEKVYTKSEVLIIIDKVFLDGKIEAIDYFLDYIESELKDKNEWFEHLTETEFMDERWIECNGSLHTLGKIKNELVETLKSMKEKKAET